MKKPVIIILTTVLAGITAHSQADTGRLNNPVTIFEKVAKSVAAFKMDTTMPPNDRITAKVKELRDLKGVFNINEAIEFKLEEDRQKKEMPAADLDALAAFFRKGNGQRWLDNAMVWMYRKQFTYRELKQLVKFQKTSAGQKLADNFPVIMLQSLTAAQLLKDTFMQQRGSK